MVISFNIFDFIDIVNYFGPAVSSTSSSITLPVDLLGTYNIDLTITPLSFATAEISDGINNYELSICNTIMAKLILKKYPNKSYQGEYLDKDDKIKYLELINAPLTGAQLELYKYHIKNDKLVNFDENTISETLFTSINVKLLNKYVFNPIINKYNSLIIFIFKVNLRIS